MPYSYTSKYNISAFYTCSVSGKIRMEGGGGGRVWGGGGGEDLKNKTKQKPASNLNQNEAQSARAKSGISSANYVPCVLLKNAQLFTA